MHEKVETDSKNIKLENMSYEVLVLLRKITQAIDLHSKDLNKNFGLTGPQLVILQKIASNEKISVTEISKSISLSQGTVTSILLRLEKKNLVMRQKSSKDKRRIELFITEECRYILDKAPQPLQKTFLDQFSIIGHWEQLMILSALYRIVDMMSAEKIDASPILATGPIDLDKPRFNTGRKYT